MASCKAIEHFRHHCYESTYRSDGGVYEEGDVCVSCSEFIPFPNRKWEIPQTVRECSAGGHQLRPFGHLYSLTRLVACIECGQRFREFLTQGLCHQWFLDPIRCICCHRLVTSPLSITWTEKLVIQRKAWLCDSCKGHLPIPLTKEQQTLQHPYRIEGILLLLFCPGEDKDNAPKREMFGHP